MYIIIYIYIIYIIYVYNLEGENTEVLIVLLFLGFKITADCDCSHEIRRQMLLGSKATTNPNSVLKSRDITLPTKVCIVKTVVFPVAMYCCESWTIKKAECQGTDAFQLWSWRRLLKVPGQQGDQTSQA